MVVVYSWRWIAIFSPRDQALLFNYGLPGTPLWRLGGFLLKSQDRDSLSSDAPTLELNLAVSSGHSRNARLRGSEARRTVERWDTYSMWLARSERWPAT
jgi:hypothetical protein